jgi:HEAT repeat protein
MRVSHVAVASVLFLALAFAQPCEAIDWTAFDDPAAVLLTARFAKSIADLPASEKAAATKRLLESLESKEVEIRRRAALTLHNLGDKSGVPTMIEALPTATGRDRDNVVVALRILKDERAIPALRKALEDKSPYVRSIAVASLGELKAAKAYDEIVLLTKDKGVKRGKKDGTLNCIPMFPAMSACYALGALGDQRAIPVLIELLDDKDLRGPAIQALEVLANQKFGNAAEKWKSWWNEQAK